MCIRSKLSRVSLSGSLCDLCASVVVSVIVLVSTFLVGVEHIRAQSRSSDHYKFEVGGHFSLIKFGEQTAINKVPYCLATCKIITEPFSHSTEVGLGARFGYNLNRALAVVSESNFLLCGRIYEGARKMERVYRVKAGKRFRKLVKHAK